MSAIHGVMPVGRLEDLPPIEATVICCLRLFYEDEAARTALGRSLAQHLGPRGRGVLEQFGELCEMTRRFARRDLMRRHAGCSAAGADETAFAAMVSAAARGEREDAMLIAVCLVRADVAPAIVGLAAEIGLSLEPLVPHASTQTPTHATKERPARLH